MKAAVNLLWCRPGRVGGSEEYLTRQLVGLRTAAADIELRLLVPTGFAIAHPELLDDVAGIEGVVGPSLPLGRVGRIAAEWRWLPHQFADADVVHHGGGTLPPGRPPTPTVLTIHDLQYRDLPQYFSPVRRRYLASRMPRSARSADVVAVPSEFVRTSVLDAFGLDPASVLVVPHGIDPPPGLVTGPDCDTGTHRDTEAELRRHYELVGRRVLVYPAITHPHKGHRLLVDLLAGPWSHPDLVLVLLGGRGAADDDLERHIADAGVRPRIRRPGRVSNDHRDGLIALAEALVFPSEYEGFGAPVIEAMALGTPVICSDQAVLPEVVGDAAVVRPLTVDAWAETLEVIATDRTAMIGRGRRRAARFTQAASGLALAGAYRRATGIGP